MTRVEARFILQKPLDEKTMSRLADSHAIYGILRVRLDPSLEALSVEYDATRLQAPDVQAALGRAGIPVGLAA